jgi:hypothetical protein
MEASDAGSHSANANTNANADTDTNRFATGAHGHAETKAKTKAKTDPHHTPARRHITTELETPLMARPLPASYGPRSVA